MTTNNNFVRDDCVSRTMLNTGEGAGKTKRMRTNMKYNSNHHHHLLSINRVMGVCVCSVVSKRVREIDTEDDGRAALVKARRRVGLHLCPDTEGESEAPQRSARSPRSQV